MERPAPLSSLDANTLRACGPAADTLDALCARAGDRCPRCHAARYYRLRDGRRRCAACGYTFTRSTGRFIDRCRLAPASWLRLLGHFAHGLSVRDTAHDLKIKYDTAHKAYAAVRLAILCDCLDARPILDERGALTGFCPNLAAEGLQALCDGCRSYVFSLARLHGDRVAMRLAQGLTARETLASPVRKKVWGPMVYTDRTRHDDALVFSCCRRGRELYLADPCRDAVHLDTWPSRPWPTPGSPATGPSPPRPIPCTWPRPCSAQPPGHGCFAASGRARVPLCAKTGECHFPSPRRPIRIIRENRRTLFSGRLA